MEAPLHDFYVYLTQLNESFGLFIDSPHKWQKNKGKQQNGNPQNVKTSKWQNHKTAKPKNGKSIKRQNLKMANP